MIPRIAGMKDAKYSAPEMLKLFCDRFNVVIVPIWCWKDSIIVIDWRGFKLLFTKMTASTGNEYLLTASATEFAAYGVARYLLVKSITGFSVSLIIKPALGKQFSSLHVLKYANLGSWLVSSSGSKSLNLRSLLYKFQNFYLALLPTSKL